MHPMCEVQFKLY